MDSALLKRFRDGDRDALELVYREHVGSVETFLRVRLLRARRLTAAAVSDLVQEVFLRAFSAKGRSGYDGEREYRPYLFTLARNLLVDWLRRTSREAGDLAAIEALVDSEATQLDGSEMFPSELLAATARYVASLEPQLRKVHEHRFVLAESQVSAAEAIGVSRQTLRRLERDLVDGLRSALRREGGSEVALLLRERRSRSTS